MDDFLVVQVVQRGALDSRDCIELLNEGTFMRWWKEVPTGSIQEGQRVSVEDFSAYSQGDFICECKPSDGPYRKD